MPSYQLADIVADIRSRQRGDAVTVVAVDGPSGSGKSRLSRRVGRALGEFVLIRVDDLVPGWDGLLQVPPILRSVLEPLANGEPVTYRRWSWKRDDWMSPLRREPRPVVVVEGCGAGSLEVADLLTYLIWVDAPEDLRRERALARDGESYVPNWERWAAQERALFAENRTRERADLILDGRLPVR